MPTPSQNSQTDELRIYRHRREFTLNKGVGPMLQMDELSAEEIAVVNVEFLARCAAFGVDDLTQIYRAYVETLHTWGIICPHPMQHRLYDGWRKIDVPLMFDESKWFTCQLCATWVINR